MSCESESGKLQSRVRRVRVLENGDISYIILNAYEAQVLRAGDTVWINTAEHVIDEQSDSAMLAQITPVIGGTQK